APWRDFAWLDEAALIPLDSVVTEVTVDGASPPQVARGSVVTDTDGVRQSTLLFAENTTATLVLSDGTLLPVDTLHIRASEYTVGPNGPQAMPGPLPPNSAYTYAVELSADEAIAAGAKSVRFNQPVIHYVENFLDFPVGEEVPAGYYDRDRATWLASEDGLVVKIVGIVDGQAELDGDGDDVADYPGSLGDTEAERRQLAELYPIGQELWRVPIPHFTPWDLNWPYRPPMDAIGPNGGPPRTDKPLDDPCERSGSIIECQNQILGESFDVTGTPFRLNYRSDRVLGRAAANTLDIPLSGASLPASLERIELTIEIAGRRFEEVFSHTSSAIAPNQLYSFTWDGRDAYGRDVQGAAFVDVTIRYVYPLIYTVPALGVQSFALP
ncbi:MAG TPA: hypothetical protein VFX76_18855, partial [Roseiflexaceae bacterium]|nr:hypothetical protein [Roseiflexaceae bacterium]